MRAWKGPAGRGPFPSAGSPSSGPAGHRWRDTGPCCFRKGEEGSGSSWQAGLSAKVSELSVPCPLCVSGLGTCSVLLRSSLVIWKHLQGNVAFTFLSFFSPWYWEYTTPAVLLLSGGGGYDVIVCLFVCLKMKNKKLYIIYIIYVKHTHLHRHDDKEQFLRD